MTTTVYYNYTGTPQYNIVPAGATVLNITACGAQGGNGIRFGSGGSGGSGACVRTNLNVTPGQNISIIVGGRGLSGGSGEGQGGYNGGGTSGASYNANLAGSGGGGMTNINISGNYFIIAGGGGGGGAYNSSMNGGSGGYNGTSGSGEPSGTGGGGGNQSTGGSGGTGAYANGVSGSSGNGGNSPEMSGAGGGGYFGGGGGGQVTDQTYSGSGGGGGSSWVNATITQNTIYTSGAKNGDGQVVFTYTYTPILYSPTNASTQNKTYPPLTTDINFTWLSGSPLSSNLIVAKDINFNLIVVDTTIANNYSIQSLEAGNYWWKVRYYNSTSGTYGNYSDTFNFTLSNIQSISGTNIQGTIYELLNGVQSNIDQAYVEIYNATWTSTMVTGTNGYYLFQNLDNDTYWIRAYKDGYDTTVSQAVSPVNGSTTTQNILMKKTVNQYVPTDHYVKFTVQTLWGTKYPNVLVSAFKGSDVIASKTGTTGTDGSVSLLLLKEQSYRITAVNTTQGINTEITITPHETEYIIIVTSTVTPWWEDGSQTEYDAIDFVVTSSEINSTHAYINATYNDSLAQTTAWTIYLNQTNITNASLPQTTLQSSTGTGNASVSFIVTGYTGKNYLVNLKATHTTYGSIQRSYGVGFKGLPGGQLDYIPNILKAMIAIGLLIFVAAMFGQTSKNQGAGVICALGWILLALGFFAYFDTIKIAAGLTIATIFAVIVNMSERNKQEGMT